MSTMKPLKGDDQANVNFGHSTTSLDQQKTVEFEIHGKPQVHEPRLLRTIKPEEIDFHLDTQQTGHGNIFDDEDYIDKRNSEDPLKRTITRRGTSTLNPTFEWDFNTNPLVQDHQQSLNQLGPINLPKVDFTEGMNFAEHLLCLEQLKETVSPFDSSDLIQVIANPQKKGSYITLETVNQEVLPFKEQQHISQVKEKSLDCCKQGKQFQYKVNKLDLTCEFCQKIQKQIVSCGCDSYSCKKIKCQHCHAKMLVELMVKNKTNLHSRYIDQSVLISDSGSIQVTDPKPQCDQELTLQANYYLIRFWNEQNQCFGRFYFQDQMVKFEDKVILVGEEKELYFIYSSESEVESDYFFAEIDFDKLNKLTTQVQELKPAREILKQTAQIPRLRTLLKGKQEILNENILPRLFKNRLIWTTTMALSYDAQKRKDLKDLVLSKALKKATTKSIVHDLSSNIQYDHDEFLLFLGTDNRNNPQIIRVEYKKAKKYDTFKQVQQAFQILKTDQLTDKSLEVSGVSTSSFIETTDPELKNLMKTSLRCFGNNLYFGFNHSGKAGGKLILYEDAQKTQYFEIEQKPIFQFYFKSLLYQIKDPLFQQSFFQVSMSINTFARTTSESKEQATHKYKFDMTGLPKDFKIKEILHFNPVKYELKIIVEWKQGPRKYLAVLSSQTGQSDVPQILLIGQHRSICSYPLLVQQSLQGSNQLMIANLQLNSPQTRLNFGDCTVVGIATETQNASLQDQKIQSGEKNLECTDLFVLIRQKVGGRLQIIRLRIDCFGLSKTEEYKNLDTERPFFLDEQFTFRVGLSSAPYQQQVIEGVRLNEIFIASIPQFLEIFPNSTTFEYVTQKRPALYPAQKTIHTVNSVFYIEQEQSVDGGEVLRVRDLTSNLTENHLVHAFPKYQNIISIRAIFPEQHKDRLKGSQKSSNVQQKLHSKAVTKTGKYGENENVIIDRLLVLTCDFKIHYIEYVIIGDNDPKIKIETTELLTELEDWPQNSEDSTSLIESTVYKSIQRVLYFDSRICIFMANDNMYSMLFDYQKIVRSFKMNLFDFQILKKQDEAKLILDAVQIPDTKLLLITRQSQSGASYFQAVAIPSSRDQTIVTSNRITDNREQIKLGFLPKNLVCVSNKASSLFFCYTTNMLIRASKTQIQVQSPDLIMVDKKTWFRKFTQKQQKWIKSDNSLFEIKKHQEYKYSQQKEIGQCILQDLKLFNQELIFLVINSEKIEDELDELNGLQTNDEYRTEDIKKKKMKDDVEAQVKWKLIPQRTGESSLPIKHLIINLKKISKNQKPVQSLVTQNFVVLIHNGGRISAIQTSKTPLKTLNSSLDVFKDKSQQYISGSNAMKFDELQDGKSFMKEVWSRKNAALDISQLSFEDSPYVDPTGIFNGIEFFYTTHSGRRKVLWDLDENEVIKEQLHLPKAIQSQRFSNSIIRNEDRSLFFDEQTKLIATTFCRLDLEWVAKWLNEPTEMETSLALQPFVSNFRNQSVLSAFVEDLDDQTNMRIVTDTILNILKVFQTQKGPLNKKTKQKTLKNTYNTMLQDLHNILVSPCYVGVVSNHSHMAKYLGIEAPVSQVKNLASTNNQINNKVQHLTSYLLRLKSSMGPKKSQKERNDKQLSVLLHAFQGKHYGNFKLLVQLLSNCSPSDICLYDIVQECQQFQTLCMLNSSEVSDLLEVCNRQTKETEKVTELLVPESFTRISFNVNTPFLTRDEIEQNFKVKIEKPTGTIGFLLEMLSIHTSKKTTLGKFVHFIKKLNANTDLKLQRCNVQLVDVEWLDNNLTTFLTVVIKNDSNFDNVFVQNLLKEMDFWYPIFFFIFLPYISYFGFVTYYFCFIITDGYEPRTGFLDGSRFAVALRFLILIFTFYQGLLEFLQLWKVGRKKYFHYKNYSVQLKNLMLLLNVWIITEHSTSFTSVESTRLAQVASLELFQLWYLVIQWMRIFDKTAVYVRLIQDTIWNTRYFMIMLFIIIATFGSSFLVLDRQVKIQRQLEGSDDQYIQVSTQTMGSDLTDSFIYQYLVMYGSATQEGFHDSPSVVLLWAYYIVAIFLTNVTFLNLLIAVMTTTYERVMETKARGMLIERTRIYAQYIVPLNFMYPKIEKKFNKRYMYIASKRTSADFNGNQSIEASISSFKKDIRKEVGDLHKLVMKQEVMIDQLMDQSKQETAQMKEFSRLESSQLLAQFKIGIAEVLEKINKLSASKEQIVDEQ